MRVQLSDEQAAISDLAGQILSDQIDHQRLRAMERAGETFAADTWRALAKADLLGIGLPEDVGGAGYDLLGAALVLEQVGRTVAPVPYFATIVLGAQPLERFGSDGQVEQLEQVLQGEFLLSAALLEGTGALPPASPTTTATVDGPNWRLDGQKVFVPWGQHARAVLVPAATSADASSVFLVPTTYDGVTVTDLQSTSGEPLATVSFDSVYVGNDDLVGAVGDGREIVEWLTPRAVAALCATAAGVCEGALALTATYTSERKQFDVPIATFQAVAHRAADAYIDTNAVLLTARQAAWRLSEGLPADEAVAIAKFWAAEGGQRVVRAAQHLHGGIGVDLDYPLHRYYRWAKMLELTMGGAHTHLTSLGSLIATG